MNILVLGSGGREHAMLTKLRESVLIDKLFIAPGNGGTDSLYINVNIELTDFKKLKKFILENDIDLTVVGPEAPLAAGIADFFKKENLAIFGPSRQGAMLETSKTFTKDLMNKYNIPTAKYQNFSNYQEAFNYIQNQKFPLVIKASGLAAGKGAVVCEDKEKAESTLHEMMVKKIFGNAANEIVIEEFLKGEEASIFVFYDGNNYQILPAAQDHKQIFDNDEGPNTGGMGSYCPAPLITPKLSQEILSTIIKPTLKALKQEEIDYQGIIFFGIMITEEGPKVIEYNCRFGDPETQVVLPIFDGDLAEIMLQVAQKKLPQSGYLPVKEAYSVCVVLASGGYPGEYEKHKLITESNNIKNSQVIHAGTIKENGKLYTNGGRVMALVSKSSDLQTAINIAYEDILKINFEGMTYRSDIGKKGLKYI